MKRFTYFLFFILLGISSYAQSYVITAAGDSLFGKFTILENSTNHEYVRLKGENGKQTFEILEVKKLVEKNGTEIVPILVEGKYRFGKVIVKGYMTKYLFTPMNASQKFQEEVLIKLDGSTLVVPGSIGFRGLMTEFTKECPRVSGAINNKEYKSYETDKIVADFNACVIEGETIRRTSAADTAEKLETSNLDPEISKKIADFKTLLNYSTKISDKDEALEMFDDIVDKLSKGETIPNYLKNAFKRSIAQDDTLTELYKEIVKENN